MLHERSERPLPKPAAAREIVWQDDLDEARRRARESGRRLLVVAQADWDVPSREAARDVWTQPAVIDAAASYVPLFIDATDTNDGIVEHALASLAIDRIPTVLILSPRGDELARHEGAIEAGALVELLGR